MLFMPLVTDEEAFREGARDWCRGDPMPSWPRRASGVTFWYWLGFMRARARDFFRRREMALYPDRIEPRP